MKINPKKAALIGFAATTLFSLPGCSPKEIDMDQTIVYGPPSLMQDTIWKIEDAIEDTTNEKEDNEESEDENSEDNNQ